MLSGGSVIVSGSEVAYAVDFTTAGTNVLADVFGAYFAADDSGSYAVSGVGSLASVGSFTYAGPSAPYEEDYPDVLGAVGSGEPLLEYATGELGMGRGGPWDGQVCRCHRRNTNHPSHPPRRPASAVDPGATVFGSSNASRRVGCIQSSQATYWKVPINRNCGCNDCRNNIKAVVT